MLWSIWVLYMQAALPESHHRCAMGQQKVAVLTTLGLHPYFVYLLTFFIQKIETSLFSNYLYTIQCRCVHLRAGPLTENGWPKPNWIKKSKKYFYFLELWWSTLHYYASKYLAWQGSFLRFWLGRMLAAKLWQICENIYQFF